MQASNGIQTRAKRKTKKMQVQNQNNAGEQSKKTQKEAEFIMFRHEEVREGGQLKSYGSSTYSERNTKPKETPVTVRLKSYTVRNKNYLNDTCCTLNEPPVTLMMDEDGAIAVKDIQHIALKMIHPTYYVGDVDEKAISAFLIAAGMAPSFDYATAWYEEGVLVGYTYQGKYDNHNYHITLTVVK